MKLFFSGLGCLSITLFFSCHCFANNYYFSTTSGNDSRTFIEAQNQATPWKTIDKFNAIFPNLQPGDSVLFKRGEIFDGGMIISKSGLENAPIVISAYGEGEKPEINGFQVISMWTSVGEGIFESEVLPVGSKLNMVVINGQNYSMGRFPNSDATNGGYLTVESHNSGTITDEELPAKPIWAGAELVLRNQRWVLDRAPITNQLGNMLSFDASSLDYFPSAGSGYFIQNDIKTLDQFGEWYFNPITKKLSIYFGDSSLEDQEVLIPVVDVLLDISTNHITLENLAFSGANEYGLYNHLQTLNNIKILQCIFNFSGIDAIHNESGIEFRVENCFISNSNNNAIYLSNGCINSVIRNNVITNTGTQAGMGQSGDGNYTALYNRAAGLVAEYNTIINTGYIGISFSGSSTMIKNNYIDTFCTVKDDGSGIYTYIGPMNNTTHNQKVVGNIILNGIGAPDGTKDPNYSAAEGIYLDENVNHIEVLDNTIAYCANYGIFVHNARDFTLVNNTAFNNRKQMVTIKDSEAAPIVGGDITGNIFFAKDLSKLTASFKTLGDDIADFGTFDQNFYARPFNDIFTIETETNSNSPDFIYKELDLSGWQNTYGQDLNSKKSPIVIPKFELDSIGALNRYSNGAFDTNPNNLSCWSPIDNCSTSWNSTNVLDGRSIEIATNGATRLMLRFGAVESAKQYLLKFSVVSSKEARLEVLFREGSPSWDVLTPVEVIKISPERTEYELFFSYPNDGVSTNIEFFSESENLTYWLDNVELYEVRATPVNPDDRIRFEYNPTKIPITIPLDTSYIDVKNEPYVGSLTLAPFESVILMEFDVISSVLPVELSRFFTTVEDCKLVAVNWTAEIEESFSHYELEKSEDGLSFSSIYQPNPNSSPPPKHYEFLDFTVRKQNYYRLKMVDRDGSFKYSRVIVQQTDCPGAIPDWEIYPNPVTDSTALLNIRLYANSGPLNLKLTDQYGRMVKQLNTQAIAGWNTITWALNGLAPGLYLIFNSNIPTSKAYKLLVIED